MITKPKTDELHDPIRVTVYEAKDEIPEYAEQEVIDLACYRLRTQAINEAMQCRLDNGQTLKIVITEAKRKTYRMATEITIKVFVEVTHAATN